MHRWDFLLKTFPESAKTMNFEYKSKVSSIEKIFKFVNMASFQRWESSRMMHFCGLCFNFSKTSFCNSEGSTEEEIEWNEDFHYQWTGCEGSDWRNGVWFNGWSWPWWTDLGQCLLLMSEWISWIIGLQQNSQDCLLPLFLVDSKFWCVSKNDSWQNSTRS